MPTQFSTYAGPPRRILVRGVNWLGDAVMTTPALQRLREHFPQIKIVLVTHEKLADLWLGHPSADEVITFTSSEGPWAVARRVRRLEADLALVLPNSPRSALEVWLARIPHRIGYARPWRNWLLTQAVPARQGHMPMRKRSVSEIKRLIHPGESTPHPSRITLRSHQIYDYLHLVAALGAAPTPIAPFVHVTPDEVARVVRQFGLESNDQPGSPPLFGVSSGAEYGPAKRWPTERFIAAAAEVRRRTSCQWLVLGGKGDVEIAREVSASLERAQSEPPPPLNLAGKTTLRELMALLKLCRVLLTNDSGPMHIAAALGTPVVVPFGSTSPDWTGPGLPGDERHALLSAGAPCSPCFRRVCPIDFRCMTAIGVEQAVEAILQATGSSSKSH